MSVSTQRRVWLASALAGAAVAVTAIAFSPSAPAAEPDVVPDVFAGYDNLDVVLPRSLSTNVITVPAGSYAITAKASPRGTFAEVNCRLSAGSNFDVAADMADHVGSIALNVVHTTSSTRSISLICQNTSTTRSLNLEHIKIVATRVNSVTDTRM